MVLPCNQVTVSTENQSDLLRKALGLPHPGPCSGRERQQLSTLTPCLALQDGHVCASHQGSGTSVSSWETAKRLPIQQAGC